jgi:hypothetical protein
MNNYLQSLGVLTASLEPSVHLISLRTPVDNLIKKHFTLKATEDGVVPYIPSRAIRPELVFVKGQLGTLNI